MPRRWTPITPLLLPPAPPEAHVARVDRVEGLGLPSDDLAHAFLRALALLPSVLPWIYPPSSAIPFSQPQLNTPVSVGIGSTVTILDWDVQAARAGVIRRFGNAGSAISDLRWSILLRGNPVAPIAGYVGQFGTIAAPTIIEPGILLRGGDNVRVQVTNIGLGAVSGVQARIDGYVWTAGVAE